MSVAFAAPRQRGKGEITPAAIQKVREGPGRTRGCFRPGPGGGDWRGLGTRWACGQRVKGKAVALGARVCGGEGGTVEGPVGGGTVEGLGVQEWGVEVPFPDVKKSSLCLESLSLSPGEVGPIKYIPSSLPPPPPYHVSLIGVICQTANSIHETYSLVNCHTSPFWISNLL